MPPIASRLQSDLEALTEKLADLIRELPINRTNRNSGGVVFIAPEFSWVRVSSEKLNVQLAIKRDYDEWFEIFQSIFADATDDMTSRIQGADGCLRNWIELSSNWSISSDRANNEKELRADAKQFFDLLTIVSSNGPTVTILVPDTNAIAGEPTPSQYKTIVKNDTFVFLLLPTVLAELDNLKTNHKNSEFRAKVDKAIKRIKGWRNQGNLRDGVKVDRTITVKAVASEPDMDNTLSWLDKDNHDDRIIASVLKVQSRYPNAQVILVTGDINLLNKADVARIDTAEPLIS